MNCRIQFNQLSIQFQDCVENNADNEHDEEKILEKKLKQINKIMWKQKKTN